MPPKRKTANFKKENQLLATRLIQISMEVEKYLFRDKPISAATARKYVVELEELCKRRGNDARTMQVTEKLTRQMKFIINQHESTCEPSTEDIGQPQPPSEVQVPGSSEKRSKNNDINDFHTQCNNTVDDSINENEVAKRPADRIEQYLNKDRDDTVSNMEIENHDIQTSLASQSILIDKVDTIEYSKENPVLEDAQEQINSNPTKVKPRFLPPTKSIKPKDKKPSMVLTPNDSNIKNVTFEINSQNVEPDAQKQACPKQKGRKKTKVQKQNNSKPKKEKNNKTAKEPKKLNAVINNINNTNSHTDPVLTVKINTRNTKVSAHTTSKDVTTLNDSLKAVHEDLTWVENIKYVREVRKDELIPVTTENFWENLNFAGLVHNEDFF